ncbi:MAG: TlpA disulfide reductase family protein [Chlorobiaceae bacterium]
MATFLRQKVRVLLLAVLFCFGFCGRSFALDAGTRAPDFELSGAEGPVRLSSNAGSVVYLDFWASWCGPCRQSFAWMNAMQEKYRAQGLRVVGVNLDASGADAKKFLKETPAKFTIAFDSKGETPKAFGVKGMPTSFLIGRDGKVISQHLGFKEADRESLEKQIEGALEGGK